jgi:hypothetical protein
VGEGDWDEWDEGIDSVNIVAIVVGALFWVFPYDVIGEKHAVAGPSIDVVVTVGSGHEADVIREIVVFIEPSAVFVHASEEESFEGGFEGAFPCFETVVIMELAASQPKLSLAVIDDISDYFSLVAPATAPARVA